MSGFLPEDRNHYSYIYIYGTLRRKPMPSMHDFTMTSIAGKEVNLSDYAGRVCLVVNVASQ